jgi:hypothetical protein
MKNIWAIVGFFIFIAVAFFQANDLDKKDKRIRELEFEIRMLKADKYADSVVNSHVSQFRKKLGLP